LHINYDFVAIIRKYKMLILLYIIIHNIIVKAFFLFHKQAAYVQNSNMAVKLNHRIHLFPTSNVLLHHQLECATVFQTSTW